MAPLTRSGSGNSVDGGPPAKRARRAAPKPDPDYSEEEGEAPRARASSKRTGKANKKRDERSALAEIWMLRNEAGAKPSPELKEQFADILKVSKDDFWELMKKYALKSKHNCVPDFEQISHHMKDRVDLLQELRVQGVDFWWELDASGQYYRPNTANLKNFKPASGLLHHFYSVFIRDPQRYEEVRRHRPPGGRYRVEPEELEELVEKLSPFRLQPEPKALLVIPRHNQALRGTYALAKKIAGYNVFIRPQRSCNPNGPGGLATVLVNGTSMEVPQAKRVNYAQNENGLVLLCKEEKKESDVDESSYRDVPLRLRVPSPPNQKPIEASVADLHSRYFQINDATIWPIRSLLPPMEVAGDLDYGAVWNGCFAPFPRTATSMEEFWANFDEFPPECFDYYFSPGLNGSEHVLAEDYIRFMSWFANFDEGMGPECCNARALFLSLYEDGMPFFLQSKNEELRASQRPGSFALRMSDTKPECLTIEVLSEENHDEGSPFAVLCFRVRVRFVNTPVEGSPDQLVVSVEYCLEEADGSVAVGWSPSLSGPILERIEQQCALPRKLRLVPWAPQESDKAPFTRGRKRPRGPADDTTAPPLARLGLPGVSSFNDATFDMSGEQAIAAAQVVRGASNVLPSPTWPQGKGKSAPEIPIPPGGPATWRANIPMPEVSHEPSFGLPREASITRDASFGFPLRGLSVPGIARDHSLALGRDSSLGLGMGTIARDTSFGSFNGDLHDDSLKGLSGLSALSEPLKTEGDGGR